MRKLVVSVLTSLDGYYEGPGGDLSQLPFDDAFDTHNLELLRGAETLVYGGTWFEANRTFWSGVAADPAQSARNLEIARLVGSLESVVISDSVTVNEDSPWATTTRVVPRADGPAEISRLRGLDGGDILMFGSATTWNPFLAAGLVDELIVLVGPALIGNGSKLYTGPRAGLRLAEARVLPDSELVELRYHATGM